MNMHNKELLRAASADVRFHLRQKTATFHFHTLGRDNLWVTIPLDELQRIYQKIDRECRTKRAPFAPVTVRPRH